MKRQAGALSVVTPLLVIVILILSTLALDGARLFSLRKDLQAQANLAATAAVGKANTCGGDAAEEMVSRARAAMLLQADAQGLDGKTQSISVQEGIITARDGKVLSFEPADNFLMTNGVAVEIKRVEPISRLLPESVLGSVTLTASAAAQKEVYATFYTESFTAELSTAKSPLLEPIFRYVLGDSQLTLKALSLEQLAHTVIDLESLLHHLTTEMPVLGDLGLGEILGSDIPAHVVVGALKSVDGLTSDTLAMLDEIIAAPGIHTNIKLEDVVGVLGDGAVDAGAKIPLLEALSGIVLDLANRPPFNGVIEVDLEGLLGPLGLDENLEVKLEIELENTPKPIIAPARMVQGDNGTEWIGSLAGADIILRLVLYMNIGAAEFSGLKLSVPLELRTGATTARLVGADCAAGSVNTVNFDFEVERSVLSLETIHDGKYDGIEVGVLVADEEPEGVCFPAIAKAFCPVYREDVTWTHKYTGLLGTKYGDCCYPPVKACGKGLVDVRISSTPVTGEAVPTSMLYFDDLPLDAFEAISEEVSGDTGSVLRKSVTNLLDGISVDHASIACIPLDGLLNGLVDVITPVLDGLLVPLSDYLLGPLLEALGVNLGTATVHVIAAKQPSVKLLQYCGPEGC